MQGTAIWRPTGAQSDSSYTGPIIMSAVGIGIPDPNNTANENRRWIPWAQVKHVLAATNAVNQPTDLYSLL